MAKAMTVLRGFLTKQKAPQPEVDVLAEAAFDARIRAMGGLRPGSVSRAVLLRTKPARREA